jgi:hypothetical protein
MSVGRLKPIETRYAGILFRSRIEARWALFYDKIHVPYQYEAEGYDLNGELYLPDFWMPQQGCFIEIKGAEPTLEEQCRAALLAQLSGKRAFIFGPLRPFFIRTDRPGRWRIGFACLFREGAGGSGYLWCSTWRRTLPSRSPTFDRGYNSATDELVHTYRAARSARF